MAFNLINKVTSRCGRVAVRVSNSALRRLRFSALKWHSTKHRITGAPARHIVISGFPRAGTTLLYNMLRHSLGTRSVFAPPREISALSTMTAPEKWLVTKRPLDVLKLGEIENKLGPYRQLFHVLVVRDPRDLISSRHKSVPNEFFQGVDYQFFVRPGFTTYTAPGVATIYDAVRSYADKERVLVVRYEDVIENPEAIRETLARRTGAPFDKPFSSFHESAIPKELTKAMNGVRPVRRQQRAAWTKSDRFKRVCAQLELFPELENMVSELGYMPFAEVCQQYNLTKHRLRDNQGTIVAFHTDDSVYSNEAKRCRTQLEALGLDHDFTLVPRKEDWVSNCAAKPQFLLESRKRLRGPLLYIDVDTFVHRNPWPYLSQYDADLAVYIHGDGSLCSGTIFIADTQGAVDILSKWAQLQSQRPGTYDQRTLNELVQGAPSKSQLLNIAHLPPNFVYIHDRDDQHLYGAPIIEHFQASRIAKSGSRGTRMEHRIKELSVREVAWSALPSGRQKARVNCQEEK